MVQMNLLQNRNRDTDVEHKRVDTGRREGRWDDFVRVYLTYKHYHV